MESAIGSAALKAALAAARQLPKLTHSGRVAAERRATAYERFSRAVWAVVESDSSARAIQSIAGKALGGIWYHPMFVRTSERAMTSQGELLGAYGGLRLVAPNAIVDAAEQAADGVAELAATTVGDSNQHAKQQRAVGSAMITFDLLCRIDLGVDRHPSAPKLSWYSPISWWKQIPWRWRTRRGDWPPLSASTSENSDAMTKALASYQE